MSQCSGRIRPIRCAPSGGEIIAQIYDRLMWFEPDDMSELVCGVCESYEVSEDGKTISGRTARPLAAGAYNLNWRAASADGHRMTGVIAFTVR